MKKNTKIIIGIIGTIIAVFAVLGAIIVIYDATTITNDDIYGEKFENGESIGNFPNTLNKENIDSYAKYIAGETNASYKVFETTYYWVIEITGQGYFIIEKSSKEVKAIKWSTTDNKNQAAHESIQNASKSISNISF
ncbi:MAG: hypothetical protein ACRC1M_00490 [Methanobacteriaceae archaeon]